jgi:general secretion pathway protein N
MSDWLRLSPRGWAICAAAFVLALLVFLPLRVGVGLFGLGEMGIAARTVHGSVWSGQAEELQAGAFRLGTVDVGLSPIQLLVGRASFDLSRKAGAADDIEGALSVGFATRGIDDVTGMIPLGGAFAPLPIVAVALQDVSISFSGEHCLKAEGRVRALMSGTLPGLDLANGMFGQARCDGAEALIPLVSQSGSERIDVRISSSGRYRAVMSVTTTEPAIVDTLRSGGFRRVGSNQVLHIDGRL